MKLLIGCDPEFFVRNQHGNIVSAASYLPGTKEHPYPVEKGAVQVDGVLAEFNIDPAESANVFVDNISCVVGQLSDFLPAGFKLICRAAHTFNPDEMSSFSPEEAILGCDPDYNAWLEDKNRSPDGPPGLRTASGHIHVGWTEGKDVNDISHRHMAFQVVREMDFGLALPTITTENPREKQRRLLYGQAGASRIKTYGVEYRVLSNCWLQTELTVRWAYHSAVGAVKRLQSGEPISARYADPTHIINTHANGQAAGIVQALREEPGFFEFPNPRNNTEEAPADAHIKTA